MREGRGHARADIAMRVLLVEDMDDLRESFAWLIRNAGCEVLAAPCGRDALDALGGFAPDLVLTDFMMPQMDGIELIRRLRSFPSLHDVPMVMATANDAWNVEQEARAAGATDVVYKPLNILLILDRFSRGAVDPSQEASGASPCISADDGHAKQGGFRD